MSDAPRTIDCPICGRETGVTPHISGQHWTPRQLWLLRRMRALGFPPKIINQALGSTLNRNTIYTVTKRYQKSDANAPRDRLLAMIGTNGENP